MPFTAIGPAYLLMADRTDRMDGHTSVDKSGEKVVNRPLLSSFYRKEQTSPANRPASSLIKIE
ncbi:MAG: hypothetical protein ACE5FZ_00730 [Nitrospiria bacterium]